MEKYMTAHWIGSQDARLSGSGFVPEGAEIRRTGSDTWEAWATQEQIDARDARVAAAQAAHDTAVQAAVEEIRSGGLEPRVYSCADRRTRVEAYGPHTLHHEGGDWGPCGDDYWRTWITTGMARIVIQNGERA